LAELVGAWAPRRILLVGTTDRAGAGRRLAGYDIERFGDFSPNPRLDDALAGARIAEAYAPDLILGVGGGSALDVAKLVRGLPTEHALDALQGRTLPVRRAPLVLVPTTAGTGSEVTSFATVYVDGVKHSLDHPSVRADLAVVDPELARSCPPEVAYSGALDALSHAVESTWALRSTVESRALAADALGTIVAALRTAGEVSTAATRAGLAIERTRTTAAHAFAYPLTARFGVRHGLACALNLVWLLPLTAQLLPRECQDPRGTAFVARRLREISAVLGDDPGATVAGLIEAGGSSPWLSDHGVRADDLPALVRAGLGANRSANGPVRLSPELVLPRLRARLAR
jgi:alcohol dehydrogenase class IV